MGLSDEQTTVIDLLALHEELVGKLYAAYADRFPELDEVWRRLASAERGHARLLDSLKAKMESGTLAFNPERFDMESIRAAILFAQEQILQAPALSSLITALAIAKDIENGLLEKHYFRVADSDTPELKRIFMLLAIDTELHRNEIQKLHAQHAGN
jgi:hypothetical protein